jgi:hypothetical protein
MWQHCRSRRCGLIWDAIKVPVAFMLAPLGAPIVVGVIFLPGLAEAPEVFAFSVGMTMSAAYVITLLVGAPLFLVLRKLELTEFWIAPAVGAIVPWVAFLIVVGPLPGSVIGLAALAGAAVGTGLWLIARPDRQRRSS